MAQAALTADDAFALYKAALDADALMQNGWHGRSDDGRALARGLGVLGPDVNGPGDCPAQVMPRWLAQMVPGFFDRQRFDDAKAWGLAFYAELKRLGGNVPFSVVHDWQANTVCPLAIDVAEKRGKPAEPHQKVQALHIRALAGDVAPRTEWFEALQPAYRQTYAYAYAYADAYADAYAYADADADADAYANAWKRLATGVVEALARVPSPPVEA